MLPEKSQSYSEGEHGFKVKKIRVDVKLTQEIREKVQQLVVDEDEVFSLASISFALVILLVVQTSECKHRVKQLLWRSCPGKR